MHPWFRIVQNTPRKSQTSGSIYNLHNLHKVLFCIIKFVLCVTVVLISDYCHRVILLRARKGMGGGDHPKPY